MVHTQNQPLPVPEWYDDAHGSLEQAWKILVMAVQDRYNAFHTPLFANVGADGFPRSRVMVLREANEEKRLLRFHTDVRSDKIVDLKINPRVAVTGYDAKLKIQIRFEGRATIHHKDAIAKKAWLESKNMSQVCYNVSPASGSLIEAGNAYTLPRALDDLSKGEEHFCVICVHINTLEWLYLAGKGHRRLRCVYDEMGHVQSDWLVP